MGEVRSDPKAIDGAWVTEALEGAGVAGGAKVVHVEFAGYIGTGQTGRTARLHLTWDRPEGRPATLVAKIPSDDEHARTQAFANGTYLKEWIFYDRVAKTVGIRTPRCFLAHFDAEAPDFVLLLEDLADSRQGDQLDGLTVDQVTLAIEQAAALHTPRFGEAGLQTLFTSDTPAPSLGETATLLHEMYAATLPGFLDRLGHRLDADIIDLAARFAPSVGRWLYGTGTPFTIVHFDFRADNFLFSQTPGAPPLVVVDWQTVSVGVGACDIAYVVSGSFPEPADRAAVERPLVEEYRAHMAAGGVEQSADECWRDYRYGSLWGMIITVIATMLAEHTERGNDMLTAMAQRHGRQVLDLDALALMD